MSKRGESRCQGNCQGKVVKAYVWTALGSDGLVLILNKEHVQNERELRIRRFESYLRSQFPHKSLWFHAAVVCGNWLRSPEIDPLSTGSGPKNPLRWVRFGKRTHRFLSRISCTTYVFIVTYNKNPDKKRCVRFVEIHVLKFFLVPAARPP